MVTEDKGSIRVLFFSGIIWQDYFKKAFKDINSEKRSFNFFIELFQKHIIFNM